MPRSSSGGPATGFGARTLALTGALEGCDVADWLSGLLTELQGLVGQTANTGGLSEEEALKFVTLNPAKQLRIDNRVGSLEKGKDADFVLWSGSPLSTYARCEQTWIDGRKYFDRAEDAKMNEEVVRERAALIQRALGAKKGGEWDAAELGTKLKAELAKGATRKESMNDVFAEGL